jgi:hypothetical protein
MRVVRLDVEKGFRKAELLAALVVDPFAERTLVIARNHFDLELLGAGAADVAFEADLPLHVGIHRGLEIQAGKFRPLVVRASLSRRGFRRAVAAHDALEPVQHSHCKSPPGCISKRSMIRIWDESTAKLSLNAQGHSSDQHMA